MSNPNGSPVVPLPPGAPAVVRIVVEYNPATGATTVSGPIDNRFACYGILELAKEAILKHGLEALYGIEARRVQTLGGGGLVLPPQ